MAVTKYFIETSDLGKLIQGESCSLSKQVGNIKGLEIELVDNPTNGDMIMAIFNPYKVHVFSSEVRVYFSEKRWQMFSLNWWDALYRGVEK